MTTSLYIVASLIALIIISVLVHFILFALTQFDRKKKQETLMIENAAMILDKIDKLKHKQGGVKMDKDLKTVAKYLAEKIDTAKSEIIEEMETRFEELIEGEGTTEPEEEDNEFDAVFGEDEPEDPEEEEEPKKLPDSLDISKRTAVTPPEEKKEKKRGFFSKK